MNQKIKKTIIKEFLYYLITLAILILIAHSDIISNPSARLNLMSEKENYFHPFLYSFVVYFVLFVLRKSIDLISKLFEKKESK